MRKSHRYNELSNITCFGAGCTNKLKKRMIEQKDALPICYQCYRAKQSHTENPSVSAKEVRTGKVPGRKKGKYSLLI